MAPLAARAGAGDVGGLLALAEQAPFRQASLPTPARWSGKARVAVAGGAAFSFAYPDDLERLEEAGAELVGFEFHYSALDPPGDALVLSGRLGRGSGGFASDRLLASYLHVHLGADPGPAERFVACAARG